MRRKRNRSTNEVMTLVSAGGNESEGTSELARSYGRRILREVKYCTEKIDFLLTVLTSEEREQLAQSIAEFAATAGHPIDTDELPSPHDPAELSRLIEHLANRLCRVDLERKIEKKLAHMLATPDDDENDGPVTPPGDLADRVLSFAQTFGLSLEECSVLLFFYAYNMSSELEMLFDRVAGHVKPRFIAACTGISESDVIATLAPSGALLKCGLFTRDQDDNLTDIHFSSMLVDGLSGFIGSFSHERFCRKSPESDLAPADFGIEPMSLVIVKALVESGSAFNLLLYGAPGTGKTEFAKSIAAAYGKEAWFLGEGQSGSIPDRQAALALSVASIDRDRHILIVDEADSLLAAGEGLFMAPNVMSKSWINGFLEAPTVKVIWIVNWTRNIDKSAMRRFAFAIRFNPFSLHERERIWKNLALEHGIAIEADLASRLAEDYAINVAGISQALALCTTVRGRDASALPETVLRASLESQVTLALGNPSRRERPRSEHYDPTALNLDVPVADLSVAVAAWGKQRADGGKSGLRLLFWGAPGTGKTELCRHLAAVQGIPLVVRRASDLLDKYVGGTEEKIAAAFHEAEREGAFLLIDEADSFLRDRGMAAHSWEVTQVNEFLTQMEGYSGLLACCTNFMANLDAASLRRFQLKVQFRPLAADALLRLITRYFPTIVPVGGSHSIIERLAGLATPGDLAAVAERLQFSGATMEWDRVLAELERECSYKTPRRSIGFGRE